MIGDRPVSPGQSRQFLADLVCLGDRDHDLFDALWPETPRIDVAFEGRALPIVQTDSPRPFRFHYYIGVSWPLDQYARN